MFNAHSLPVFHHEFSKVSLWCLSDQLETVSLGILLRSPTVIRRDLSVWLSSWLSFVHNRGRLLCNKC